MLLLWQVAWTARMSLSCFIFPLCRVIVFFPIHVKSGGVSWLCWSLHETVTYWIHNSMTHQNQSHHYKMDQLGLNFLGQNLEDFWSSMQDQIMEIGCNPSVVWLRKILEPIPSDKNNVFFTIWKAQSNFLVLCRKSYHQFFNDASSVMLQCHKM